MACHSLHGSCALERLLTKLTTKQQLGELGGCSTNQRMYAATASLNEDGRHPNSW
eukprot:COSAG02_NODE_49269_length_328_cov_0.515284_1_plen_54_part_10